VRRSSPFSDSDKNADIILLDTIGELASVYPLAEIVFVGGSLISHGGQSVIEPALHRRAIVTGPYTMNFEAVVREFVDSDAIIQTQVIRQEHGITKRLNEIFVALLADRSRREQLGSNAAVVAGSSNRGAVDTTIAKLRSLMRSETTNS